MRALRLAVSLVFVVSAPSFASDDQSPISGAFPAGAGCYWLVVAHCFARWKRVSYGSAALPERQGAPGRHH